MEVKLSSHYNFDSLSSRNFTGGKRPESMSGQIPGKAKDKHKSANAYLKDKIRVTTDINRPTESVSFSGSAVLEPKTEAKEKNGLLKTAAVVSGALLAVAGIGFLAAKKLKGKDIYTKLAQSETFNKILDFSVENEAKLSAIISLGMAGILKPICVLAMPGAEMEDKQFTATKNALSALVGFALSSAILDPISYGVNKFLDNPEKYLKPDSKLLGTLNENKAEPFRVLTKDIIKEQGYATNTLNSMRSFYKKSLGLFVAPAKAAITIALMPYVLKFIFGDRKKKDTKETAPEQTFAGTPVILNNDKTSVFNIFTQQEEPKEEHKNENREDKEEGDDD